MSVLNQSGEEQVECPLCMEPLEVDDLHFYPCTCGYQICRFCWNRIREGENGLCPACRKAYPENPADFTPLSQEQVAAIKTEKKAREQKRRNKTLESRRALANVRVVQNNLVFVVGLPVRLADPEILKRQEYFGKYGKIHKVVINQSTTYAGSQGPSASAYVTYVSPADALRAIQGVNNVSLDGRVLKGSLGTTKYCANFMKNQPCPKPDCMYLHELGDPKASFTKEEMHAGLHQVYERKLHNQLLAQRDGSSNNSSGNSSTNADKSSTPKEGNPSNFIPTTVVTSSHINVANSSKPNKKDSSNGNGNGNGSKESAGNKEAWPSLGGKPPSPKHELTNGVKSQENGTSESSSPTQLQSQQPAQKSKDTDSKNKNKDISTNGQPTKKSKNDTKLKQKQSNSISHDNDLDTTVDKQYTQIHSVFENESQQYLSNELDELESDRHSLLENHDLLDSSDHSLLDDDTHNLLSDSNNEVLMMQRHREMLAGLVDNSHLIPQLKSPLNGYGLLDRDMGYLSNDRHSQISQGLMEKEMLLRDRSRSEMMMRQNEMLARHNVMEPKYMPTSSIGLESASELLGGVFGSGAGAGFPYAPPPMPHHPLLNGFDTDHNTQNEGRYQAENMDKFFTDFKAQQMRLMQRTAPDERYLAPPHMLSAERLEMEHKQRMGNSHRVPEGAGHRAAGDGDDDLDFDPFKETQKALAEMMETEMMQSSVSSGDNMELVRRARMAPPGFSHLNTFAAPPRLHPHHPAGFNTNAMFSDWTQMDPAIMSTSVNFGKPPPQQLTPQQQELFARFNTLGLHPHPQPNGLKIQVGAGWGAGFPGPLPPGFAPRAPPASKECIDAK